MSSARPKRSGRVGVVLVGGLALAVVYGCSAVLGLGDYSIGGPDSGNPDAANDAQGDGGGEASCDAGGCYACTPTTTDQFLNSCSDGTCIPFDQGRITALLLPDGGLPQLPPDGG
jgi:hypothetical protein